jgi:sugar phosphate permease
MKLKLFYGWYIVFACLLVVAYNSSIFTYGWTAFMNPIAAAFGWSMTQLSLASTFRSLEQGVFNPFWGKAVDRWSPRKLMLFGVIATGLGSLLISRSTNLVMFYMGFLVMGIASSLVTNMVPTATIARWFRKDIGKANGLFYMGVGIGGVMVPVVTHLVDTIGWDKTLLYSSFGFLALGIPLSFVVRRRPEDYGMVPDGRIQEDNKKKPAPNYNFGTSVKQVIRTRAFWYLNVVIFFQTAVLGTVTLFAMPYLTSLGISRASAGVVVMAYTVVSLCGRMPMGMLSDVFRKKYIMALTLGLIGIGLLMFWFIGATSPFWLTIAFAVVYGIGISGIMPLRLPFLVEYFGSRNIGTIFGLAGISSTIASIASAPIAGWVFDTYHDYKPVWIFLVCFSIITVILMLAMPRVLKRTEAEPTAEAKAA